MKIDPAETARQNMATSSSLADAVQIIKCGWVPSLRQIVLDGGRRTMARAITVGPVRLNTLDDNRWRMKKEAGDNRTIPL